MKILIADDHPVVRKGIKQIIIEEHPSATVGEVANCEELIGKVINESWDMIVCDINMPGRSGLEALEQIKQINPKLPVLIISMYPEDQYAIRVLQAGGAGYLKKDAVYSELLKAIHTIQLGKSYITSSVSEKLLEYLDGRGQKPLHHLLSTRELEVFLLLAIGKTNSSIARQLFLSTPTISTYRARIMEKMEIHSNADIVRYALEKKMI